MPSLTQSREDAKTREGVLCEPLRLRGFASDSERTSVQKERASIRRTRPFPLLSQLPAASAGSVLYFSSPNRLDSLLFRRIGKSERALFSSGGAGATPPSFIGAGAGITGIAVGAAQAGLHAGPAGAQAPLLEPHAEPQAAPHDGLQQSTTS